MTEESWTEQYLAIQLSPIIAALARRTSNFRAGRWQSHQGLYALGVLRATGDEADPASPSPGDETAAAAVVALRGTGGRLRGALVALTATRGVDPRDAWRESLQGQDSVHYALPFRSGLAVWRWRRPTAGEIAREGASRHLIRAFWISWRDHGSALAPPHAYQTMWKRLLTRGPMPVNRRG